MSNVTPIRPGSEPAAVSPTFDIRHAIEAHHAQAKAICDLVSLADPETLFEETIGWALHAVIDHIDAAEEAAGKLYVLARGRQEEAQPA